MREMEEVQVVAQRVHADYQSSQHQLGLAEDKVNELHKTAKKQSEQLERQLREQGSLTQQILELQHQVTLIRQSSAPPVQEQNATAIDMSHVMKEMQSLRNELALMKRAPSVSYPVAVPMTPDASFPAFPIAQPASLGSVSACAGFASLPKAPPPIEKPGRQDRRPLSLSISIFLYLYISLYISLYLYKSLYISIYLYISLNK